ncbi:MAG: IclR family transcriptional regulator, partial [Desulfobacterales bacterium]|nr:IclR family transcriptional regulator [Desulfobacterales bacterium]
MAAPKKPRRLIQSIQRAGDILDLFIRDNESIGITRIAEQVNLPKTTAQGIVQTLEALEFLEKDRKDLTYRLGPKVFRLGMQYAACMDIVTIAKVW